VWFRGVEEDESKEHRVRIQWMSVDVVVVPSLHFDCCQDESEVMTLAVRSSKRHPLHSFRTSSGPCTCCRRSFVMGKACPAAGDRLDRWRGDAEGGLREGGLARCLALDLVSGVRSRQCHLGILCINPAPHHVHTPRNRGISSTRIGSAFEISSSEASGQKNKLVEATLAQTNSLVSRNGSLSVWGYNFLAMHNITCKLLGARHCQQT